MREIAERALRLVGTPFRHQGRLAGIGLDCLGVVVLAVHGQEHDQRAYPRVPDTLALQHALNTLFERLDCYYIEDAPIGSVLAFAHGAKRRVRHLAIRTDVGFVHADPRLGVVETTIVQPFIDQFAGAYRWRSSH